MPSISAPRDGKVLEELGTYDPMVPDTDARVQLNGERVDYWIGVGAQPSEKVAVLIKKYGSNGTHQEANKAAIEKLAQPRSIPERGEPVAKLKTAEEIAAEEAEKAAAEARERLPKPLRNRPPKPLPPNKPAAKKRRPSPPPKPPKRQPKKRRSKQYRRRPLSGRRNHSPCGSTC